MSRSVYTCHLLALKFEADKDYFNYTPKKRISKAILSSRSEGTMSVTTFGCVYDLEDRPFLLFFECQKPILKCRHNIFQPKSHMFFSENKRKLAV